MLGSQWYQLLITKSSTEIAPELNKLSNTSLERKVGVGSGFKERYFFFPRIKWFFRQKQVHKDLEYPIHAQISNTAKIFYIFMRSYTVRKQFISYRAY